METAVTTSAAPAQPAVEAPVVATPPAPATAVEQAIVDKDFRGYRDAKRAEASGAPLPAPEAKPAEAPAPAQAQAERPVSKRQQAINDYERRIAEQAAEIERLKQAPAAAAAPAGAAPRSDAPAAREPERASAKPAADPEPKQESFQTYDAYLDARSRWAARQELAAQRQTEAQRTEADRAQARQTERQTKFHHAITSHAATDPSWADAVSDEVFSLRPFSALAPGDKGGPLNALAEELLDSAVAPQIMRHLSEHPEELKRFAQLRDPRAFVRAFGRLEDKFSGDGAAAAAPPQPKFVSDAPPPATQVGTRAADPADPIKGAIARRDFTAFRRAKAAARSARK